MRSKGRSVVLELSHAHAREDAGTGNGTPNRVPRTQTPVDAPGVGDDSRAVPIPDPAQDGTHDAQGTRTPGIPPLGDGSES